MQVINNILNVVMVKQHTVKNINTLKNATTVLKQHTVKTDF